MIANPAIGLMHDIADRLHNLPNISDYTVHQKNDGIYLKYQPRYPEHTDADLLIKITQTSIIVKNNSDTLIADQKAYGTLDDLFHDLANM